MIISTCEAVSKYSSAALIATNFAVWFQESQQVLCQLVTSSSKSHIPAQAQPRAPGAAPVTSNLSDRVGQLETASQGWRKRIEVPDAEKFSVKGRMQSRDSEPSTPSSPLLPDLSPVGPDRRKKVPLPGRFRGKDADAQVAQGAPAKARGGLFLALRSLLPEKRKE